MIRSQEALSSSPACCCAITSRIRSAGCRAPTSLTIHCARSSSNRFSSGTETVSGSWNAPTSISALNLIYETPSDSREAAIRAWRIRREMDQRNAALRQPVHESPSYSAPSARQLKQAECAAARRDAQAAALRGVDSTSREWYERRVIDTCFGL